MQRHATFLRNEQTGKTNPCGARRGACSATNQPTARKKLIGKDKAVGRAPRSTCNAGNSPGGERRTLNPIQSHPKPHWRAGNADLLLGPSARRCGTNPTRDRAKRRMVGDGTRGLDPVLTLGPYIAQVLHACAEQPGAALRRGSNRSMIDPRLRVGSRRRGVSFPFFSGEWLCRCVYG
jgi:hypothetical protein